MLQEFNLLSPHLNTFFFFKLGLKYAMFTQCHGAVGENSTALLDNF